MTPRVWLITGTSSGFGRELTQIVLEHGDIAVATARRREALSDLVSSYPADRLLTLKLDVTVDSDITTAFAAVHEKFGRLDIVVNNAGYGDCGEVESVKDADMRKMFEANFWGTANISREAVRFMREVNPAGAGGRILQFTSTAGIQNYPLASYFSASKAAVTAFSESLAGELDPDWHIKVTVVAPGPFDTGDISKLSIAPPHPAYNNPRLPGMMIRQGFPRLGDPKKAMEVVYKLTELEDPPVHFPLGPEAVETFKAKAAAYVDDAGRFADWNKDLHKDS